ncbi:hypothetical protein S40288_02625 [Stachybotrys chartarum IBT 40288]|nr:hypothetical protein S40288_02625 [Stachybotrys chartarum IBT 40288]
MFPPVDEAVLQSNPDFALLYTKLTKAVLNPDGTTKDSPAAKERAAVKKELDQHRLKAAKQHLLAHAIATASPPATDASARSSAKQQPALREPLLDLLLMLPPLLEAEDSLPAESLSLLLSHPPLSDLETLLPDLSALVSSNLRSSALNVARVAHPSTNPSYLHRHIASLPTTAASLHAQRASSRHALAAARLAAAASLTALVQSHAQAAAHLIRALEAKHGVVARSLELRAAQVLHEAQIAETDAEQARWGLEREVYTPEAVAALGNYAAHLRDARIRTEERIRGLQDELAEYGVGVEGGEGKEKLMREMARVHSEMGKQLGDVKVDIDRLKQRNRPDRQR